MATERTLEGGEGDQKDRALAFSDDRGEQDAGVFLSDHHPTQTVDHVETADHVVTLAGQQSCRHRGVHSARHCYYDAHLDARLSNSQLRNSQLHNKFPTPNA